MNADAPLIVPPPYFWAAVAIVLLIVAAVVTGVCMWLRVIPQAAPRGNGRRCSPTIPART